MRPARRVLSHLPSVRQKARKQGRRQKAEGRSKATFCLLPSAFCLLPSDLVYPYPAMSEPEYYICLQCETPSYQFEYDQDKDKLISIMCQTCGTDDPADF